MDKLFDYFHALVKTRIDRYSHQCFGEDSIRYDFYFSLLKLSDELTPTDMILEEPMPSSCFTAKIREENLPKKQGRQTEKPEFDFRVGPCDVVSNGLIGEFAYFRRPDRASNQNRTAKHGKLLNEIFRLSLLKNYAPYSNYTSLLICVTDDEMLNYGDGSRGRKVDPIQENYILNEKYLEGFSNTANKVIESIFLDKTNELRIIPKAQTIYRKIEPSTVNRPKWATWIWDVSFESY